MDYPIVPLSDTNIKDLIYLYKIVFGNSVTQDFLLKKFNTPYLDETYFGHIAYDKDKPIAFHGAIPILMKYKDQLELAAQYGDAMTLPNYAGNGLFTKLGKLTDKQLQKANIKFVWGFPNQNSEYGYLNKLDWIYKERIQRFSIKASIIPIEKLANQFKFSRHLYHQHVNNVFKKYKTNKIIKGSVYKLGNFVSTERNHQYYNYKSFTDNFTISINNVLFWIKIKNGLLIGDIEAPSENDFHIAFKKLKRLASLNGIDYITIQASPKTIITQYLETVSKRSYDSWVVGYKNFNSNFPLDRLKLTLGDLDTF